MIDGRVFAHQKASASTPAGAQSDGPQAHPLATASVERRSDGQREEEITEATPRCRSTSKDDQRYEAVRQQQEQPLHLFVFDECFSSREW